MPSTSSGSDEIDNKQHIMDFKLLKKLCAIHAPAGDETAMTEFLLAYIKKNAKDWKVKPKVLSGPDFQNAVVLVFGHPTTAIFSHIDSIGYTVRYDKGLVKIGGPRIEDGFELVGKDCQGTIECELKTQNGEHGTKLFYKFDRTIDRGTTLTFKPNFIEDKEFVQCCYMDNRLGVFTALKVAETLENGIICFSCWEETGGGNVEVLTKYIYEKYNIRQALIADITW